MAFGRHPHAVSEALKRSLRGLDSGSFRLRNLRTAWGGRRIRRRRCRSRRRRSGRCRRTRRRRAATAKRSEQAAAPRIQRRDRRRSPRRLLRRGAAGDERYRRAVMRRQKRQDQAREEKPRREQCCGPGEHVRRAAAGHESARGADQAPTLGFLQQNHADQGEDQHQVDGDNDTQHRLIRYWPLARSYRPAAYCPRYRISGRSLHDPPWIFYGGSAAGRPPNLPAAGGPLLVLLEERDQVVDVLRVAQARKRHAVPFDLGLRVFEIGAQIGVVPDQVGAPHRVRITEIIQRS